MSNTEENDTLCLSSSALTYPKGGPHLKEDNVESLNIFNHVGQGQDHNSNLPRPL